MPWLSASPSVTSCQSSASICPRLVQAERRNISALVTAMRRIQLPRAASPRNFAIERMISMNVSCVRSSAWAGTFVNLRQIEYTGAEKAR